MNPGERLVTVQYEKILRNYFSKDTVIKEFAKNLGRLPRHPFLKSIPGDVLVCLIEANMCFVISAYNATVVLSWMALECHLRLHLSPKDAETCGQSLVDLLNISGNKGLLTRDQVTELHRLRKIRNTLIHSSYIGFTKTGLAKGDAVITNQIIISSALRLYTMVDAILHTYYSTRV